MEHAHYSTVFNASDIHEGLLHAESIILPANLDRFLKGGDVIAHDIANSWTE
ncbi:uncharacterized protein RAG0_01994 [Rhynchosporium agropyri]|uniref:Uncharacterized protein n=1 Tax=Rhynchosporium agropyri TaxID=914238 RepID=A0A1E1JZK5_9HELO|nr:uncharacterized protein RAG0_01994 [Rhynchosporium agropyri]